MVRAVGWLALVGLCACARPGESVSPERPASSAPVASSARPASRAPASGVRPAAREEASTPPGFASDRDLSLTLPAAWTACQADADCSFASLGCCHTTPVNRAHMADADRALAATGQMWCPPKAACGPGNDGTWAGYAGTCRERVCVRSAWPER